MNSTRMLAARVSQALGAGTLPVPRMIRRLGSAAAYRPSHRSILVDISDKSAGERTGIDGSAEPCVPLGGVFLPVSRSFRDDLPGLQLATRLASSQGAHLIVAYSKNSRLKEFPEELREDLGDRLVLVNLAKVHLDWKPQLESSRQRVGRFHRSNDAAEKRNLGLTIAMVLGWSTILFLDDDISVDTGPTLDPAGLARALVALRDRPELAAVGWSARNMDDHSVIGHSRERVGMAQGLFVGAGALLVRCEHEVPYFPNIYNHDWLFLVALAKNAAHPFRAIGWGGTVRQLEYDPYLRGRARSEEAGDIIGECLMNLLEDRGAKFDAWATIGYWERALKARKKLVSALHEKVTSRIAKSGESTSALLSRMQRALAAANEVNRHISADDLVHYVQVLHQDEERWAGHLRALRRAYGGNPEPRRVLANLQSGKPPARDLGPCHPIRNESP